MVAQLTLGGDGVVIGDRGHDGAVLGEHLAAVARLGQAEEANPVELPARALAQPPRDRATRQVAEQPMQLVVEAQERAAIRIAPTSSASRTKCASAMACSSM